MALPLLEVAAVSYVLAVWRLVRTRTYAWATFLAIAKPAIVAATVAAAIIEFAFLYDNTSGWALVILTSGLVLIVLDLPVLLGYSVARNEPLQAPAPEPYPPFGGTGAPGA